MGYELGVGFGEPVPLGEDGHLLALAEADGVGGAATGGADVVDEEQRHGGGRELPRRTAEDLQGIAHEILRFGISGIAGLAAQVEIEEAMILGRCGKGFASEVVTLFEW
jgi:hypothetical protein